MVRQSTILVADGNVRVREFLREVFERDGYRVRMAKNGMEALLIVQEECPHLLVTELDLPFESGLELLEQLKDHQPRIPIVVYTIFNEYQGHPSVKHAAAFIEKRGNIDLLKETVYDLIRTHHPDFLHLPVRVGLQRSA